MLRTHDESDISFGSFLQAPLPISFGSFLQAPLPISFRAFPQAYSGGGSANNPRSLDSVEMTELRRV